MSNPPGENTISPGKVAKIIELCVQGKYDAEIAREVGCCKKTVYNYRIRFGL